MELEIVNKCVCGKYHCPSCHNQMDDLFCDFCETQWTGNEKFEPLTNIDLFELFE